MSKKHKLIADLSLLGITVIWGMSFILMKRTINDIHPIYYLMLRFLLASLFLLVIFVKRVREITKKEIIYGSIIGFFLFLGMALQVLGLQYTLASKSAFITGLTVIMVPFFWTLLYRKIPSANVIIGVLTAFVGMILLNNADIKSINYGDLLTLLADFAFVAQIIFIDIFTRGKESSINIALIQNWVAAIFFILYFMIFYSSHLTYSFTSIGILTIIITGIFGTALAFTVQVIVQKWTTPTHTALIFSAEPVFGVLFATIIPSTNGQVELMPIISYIGCLLILCGMIISEINRRSE